MTEYVSMIGSRGLGIETSDSDYDVLFSAEDDDILDLATYLTMARVRACSVGRNRYDRALVRLRRAATACRQLQADTIQLVSVHYVWRLADPRAARRFAEAAAWLGEPSELLESLVHGAVLTATARLREGVEPVSLDLHLYPNRLASEVARAYREGASYLATLRRTDPAGFHQLLDWKATMKVDFYRRLGIPVSADYNVIYAA